MTNIDHDTGQIRLDNNGHEIPDPTPLELPVGFKKQETVAQMVQRLVRRDLSEYAERHGHETFAEADDFELEEDPDPFTPYETEFDPMLGRELTPADFKDPEKREHIKNLYAEAERNAIRSDALRDHIDELYRASRRAPPAPGGEGAKAPSQSSEGPKGPPA